MQQSFDLFLEENGYLATQVQRCMLMMRSCDQRAEYLRCKIESISNEQAQLVQKFQSSGKESSSDFIKQQLIALRDVFEQHHNELMSIDNMKVHLAQKAFNFQLYYVQAIENKVVTLETSDALREQLEKKRQKLKEQEERKNAREQQALMKDLSLINQMESLIGSKSKTKKGKNKKSNTNTASASSQKSLTSKQSSTKTNKTNKSKSKQKVQSKENKETETLQQRLAAIGKGSGQKEPEIVQKEIVKEKEKVDNIIEVPMEVVEEEPEQCRNTTSLELFKSNGLRNGESSFVSGGKVPRIQQQSSIVKKNDEVNQSNSTNKENTPVDTNMITEEKETDEERPAVVSSKKKPSKTLNSDTNDSISVQEQTSVKKSSKEKDSYAEPITISDQKKESKPKTQYKDTLQSSMVSSNHQSSESSKQSGAMITRIAATAMSSCSDENVTSSMFQLGTVTEKVISSTSSTYSSPDISAKQTTQKIQQPPTASSKQTQSSGNDTNNLTECSPISSSDNAEKDQILYHKNAFSKMDLNKVFQDKDWIPTRNKMNLDDKNRFIHGLNLAACGNVFPNVQCFLKVYAMCKRQALIKTQLAYLDNKLKYHPLNKVLFDHSSNQWYNSILCDEWDESCGPEPLKPNPRKKHTPQQIEKNKKKIEDYFTDKLLNFLTKVLNHDSRYFGEFRRDSGELHIAAFRKDSRDQFCIFDPRYNQRISLETQPKKTKTWCSRFRQVLVYELQKGDQAVQNSGRKQSGGDNTVQRWNSIFQN